MAGLSGAEGWAGVVMLAGSLPASARMAATARGVLVAGADPAADRGPDVPLTAPPPLPRPVSVPGLQRQADSQDGADVGQAAERGSGRGVAQAGDR
jgi:hypothetical protein